MTKDFTVTTVTYSSISSCMSRGWWSIIFGERITFTVIIAVFVFIISTVFVVVFTVLEVIVFIIFLRTFVAVNVVWRLFLWVLTVFFAIPVKNTRITWRFVRMFRRLSVITSVSTTSMSFIHHCMVMMMVMTAMHVLLTVMTTHGRRRRLLARWVWRRCRRLSTTSTSRAGRLQVIEHLFALLVHD